TSIQRLNRQTMLQIQAGVAQGVAMDEARAAIESTLDGLEFPPGYGYTFSGMGFNINFDGMDQMVRAIMIALVLMLVIMAAVFESLLFPTAIMSCVLFSIFGVYWLFWITGTEMNIMAVIGILVLMGVVVNNGIVMIEHINNLRRRGLPRTEALVEGSRERLRPILMTMGTAILAMIPIGLNTDTADGMPPYYPMARAIVGGLAFSTVVSLLFLPTIYAVLDDFSSWTGHAMARARAAVPLRRGAPGAAPPHGSRLRVDVPWRQPSSRCSICQPAIYTPMAVPNEVRKKFRNTRATRLRHQPRTLVTASRNAAKSPTCGLRIHASISALTLPEARAGCNGVSGEDTNAPTMLSGCPPASRQPSAPSPPVASTQSITTAVPTPSPR